MPDLCRCGGKMLSLGLSGDAYPFVIGKVSFKEIKLIGNRLYSQEDFEQGVRFLEDNCARCTSTAWSPTVSA